MKKFTILILTVSFLFLSCATKVSYSVLRPAELELNGAKTISVLPIKPYAYFNRSTEYSGMEFVLSAFFGIFDTVSVYEKHAIEFLQSSIEKGLLESPYIDLVSAKTVQAAVNKGYINPADIYFTGEVTYYNVNDTISTEVTVIEDKNRDSDHKGSKTYIHKDYYTREVNFDFKYQIVDSSNDKVLSYEKININASSGRYESQNKLPNPYSLIEYKLRDAVNKILKELQPYVVIKSVSLLEDKSKNPDMKIANQFAKDKNIESSYKWYSKIYEEQNIFEAGYNAAILQQSMGNLYDAEELMNNLYEKTADTRALKALKDIRYEIYMANRLRKQTEDFSDYLE